MRDYFDDPIMVLILACLAGLLVLAIVLYFASKVGSSIRYGSSKKM